MSVCYEYLRLRSDSFNSSRRFLYPNARAPLIHSDRNLDSINSFGIQFDTSGIYLVGTSTEQFNITFEEMMTSVSGIIGLLEYGLTFKVLKSIANRARRRVFNAGRSRSKYMSTQSSLWIDNSGPKIYEICHGGQSIQVSPQDLESSLFGLALKKTWDGGIAGPGMLFIMGIILEAFLAGISRNFSGHRIEQF